MFGFPLAPGGSFVGDFLEGKWRRAAIKGLACVLPILFPIGHHKHFAWPGGVRSALSESGGFAVVPGKHFYTIGDIAKSDAQAIGAKKLVVINMVFRTQERFE